MVTPGTNGHATNAAHLLVIDDDETFREALSELLREEGYEVDTADRATAAVHYLRSTIFDAVVSDLIMPGNGQLVVNYVRCHQPATPVIVISSYESAPQALAANGAGSVVCLLKPVHFDEVQEALALALRRHDGQTY
jgi:two-component system response regulator HydG